jgi:hypothetical protein
MKNLPTAPLVGQVCSYSWGYGQTNVEWFVVTAVLPKSIRIRAIKGETKETGFMCGDATPKLPPESQGEEILRRWHTHAQHGWIASMKFGCLIPWMGGKLYVSWYN